MRIAAALWAAWLLAAAAGGGEGPAAGRVHAIVVADTDDGPCGPERRRAIGAIEQTFRLFQPDAGGPPATVLAGPRCSAAAIEEAVAALRPAPADAVALFFLGSDGAGGDSHYMALPGDDSLHCCEVIERARRAGPRLVLALTDLTPGPRQPARSAARTHFVGQPVVSPTPPAGPLREALFGGPCGAMLLGATWPDRGPPRPPAGLAGEFCAVLAERSQQRPTWPAIVGALDARLAAAVERSGGPAGGREPPLLRAWRLPSEEQGMRLGAVVEDNPGGGVRILEVQAGLPAEHVYDPALQRHFRLEPGDTVLSVNGVPTDTTEAFRLAVFGSPRQMGFMLRDVRSGTVSAMTADLGAEPPAVLAAPAAGVYYFSAGAIEALRARAEVARAEAARAEAARAGTAAVGIGWRRSPADPMELLRVFAPLRLKPATALRGYVESCGSGGRGKVYAVATDLGYPAPTGGAEPLAVGNGVEEPMDAVRGDGSAESYLRASILARELEEFGASWHGLRWTTHTIVDVNPLRQAVPAVERPLAFGREDPPAPGTAGWKWREAPPDRWAPSVRVEAGSITVTFSTYSPLGQESLYRHTDRYIPGSYRATQRTADRLASGKRYMVF